ncbi:NADH-ubiquinone oxidoreductase-F iron-sulfur binding region domain-containing protein [Halorubrum halophilum]|uniref:NADH-ubiquinone oxidoreductase-F iron-sulfur binding region domain-containing protein n=1 Tax=Halorubrum halophilum TaxID=413816 RepID=UPI001F3D49EA|nr:NADH-ubiquinone oxidoreductase-F iron-sulfur binding region domain-containing protein [Halorubrum halophilum]
MVTLDGQTGFHTGCSLERIEAIVRAFEETGDVTAADPDAVVDHGPGQTTFPTPELSGLRTGVREILDGCGWRRPTDPADHEAVGGFVDPDPDAVIDLGGTLDGRGWRDLCHDAPLADTWESVRSAAGDPVVVVNAHGNAADTLLLESAPFEALDGAVALADAVGAERVIVYASADDERAVQTVRDAAANYPDSPITVDVETGPAEYRAAEPSMAIESLEGNHRLEARIRPPDLDAVGLHGRPTLVHTPRTLAHLSVALREGEPAGTRVMTVTGDVADPVTVEVPASETLETVVDAAEMTGAFKAASVGGRFGGVTDDLTVGVKPDALAANDLGSEGVVRVLADDRCLVEFVGQRAQFAADENCGRCVPCREGTTQLAGLLRDVYDGGYDPEAIEELIDVMTTSSICAFGVQAGRPTRTALSAFESEFEAHADGRCPAGSCLEPLEA